MHRYLAPIIVFAIMVPVFFFGLQRDPSELPSPYIGKPGPSFELPRLLQPQQTVGSKDYAGQVALVNIWATWCAGCRQEHAFLMKIAAENEVPVYGINWRDRREDALSWLEQLGNPYRAIGVDADGRVGIDWGVYGAPETFLIGADGTVLYKQIGPLDQAFWDAEFVPRILAARTAQ